MSVTSSVIPSVTPTITPSISITPTVTPSITPSTSCAMPAGVTSMTFWYSDTFHGSFYGSLSLTCAALDTWGTYSRSGSVGRVEDTSLPPGEIVYSNTGTSCSPVGSLNGYFIVDSGSTPYIVYVDHGIVDTFPVACPDPTPTMTPTPTVSVTPSITVTPTITPSPSQVAMMCVNSVPTFQSSSQNLVGLLTVGNVQLASGTLGNYVIDWKVNSVTGATTLTSGNAGNSDPEIQSFHPINSELVQAGVLYPVIRYININSVNYSPHQEMTQYTYSPDLANCLPTISVVAMSCQNQNTGATYGHTVTYTNTTQPGTLANRQLRYDLNPDGSTQEIAWDFAGYTIADRLTIKYMSDSGITETVIDDWVVGSDCTGYTFFGSYPHLYDSTSLSSTFNLTGYTYQPGDYILFEVRPGYNNPTNTDTNWRLQLQCFSEGNEFDWFFMPPEANDLITGSTMTLTYDSVNCRYIFECQTVSGKTDYYDADIYRYLDASAYGGNWEQVQKLYIASSSGATSDYETPYGTPVLLNGVLNIGVTGSTHEIEYTFTNVNDYYSYKNSYTGATVTSKWLEISSDPTNKNYYSDFQGLQRISMSSGDTYTTEYPYFSAASTWTFDDANRKIHIDMVSRTNGFPNIPCDNTRSAFDGLVSSINYWYSGKTQNYSTIWGSTNIFPFITYDTVDNTTNTASKSIYLIIRKGICQHSGYDFSDPEWYTSGSGTFVDWRFNKLNIRVDITNMSDPENNFEVYNYLNEDGTSGVAKLVYKVGT